MARLSKMAKREKERNSVHEEVGATYSTFIQDGRKYFQIDTYTSKELFPSGSPRQIFQFDKDNAIQLIELLKKEFDL